MIGRTLGNYRIVEQIGMGGMATVYKAYDPDTDRHVALKTLPQQYSHDEAFRERFRREAKAIARLEHIHILPVHAYGESDGTAYMVMRYMKTGTLGDRIRQGGLSLEECSRLLKQMADGLDYAHSQGIIHRDIKPSNILVDDHGNTYITDFGIAKMIEGATLDLTGDNILGTPAYMSPEQCRGEKNLTPASDIYSLGIVLYEMVTGRTPFQAETPLAVIHMQLTEPLPLPRILKPDIPEAVENVILKALSKDPALRYPSCNAMAQAFDKAIKEKPVAVSVTPPAARPLNTIPKPMPDTPTELLSERETVKRPVATEKRSGFPFWLLPVGGGLAVVVAVLLLSSNRQDTTPIATAIIEPTSVAVVLETEEPEGTVEPTVPRPTEADATSETSVDPATPIFFVTQAANFIASNDYASAIETYNDALEIDPDNVELLYGRGWSYILNGEAQQSIEDFTRIIELQPDNAKSYADRAEAYGYVGGTDSMALALEDLNSAITISPEDPTLYVRRAGNYYLLDNHRASVEDFSRAIELDDQNVDAYSGRGEVYLAETNYQAAIDDFTQVMELSDSPYELTDAYWMRGQAHTALENYDQAIEDFSQAIMTDVTPSTEYSYPRLVSYRGRAEILALRGEYDDALDDLTKAVSIDPGNSEVFAQRGEVHLLNGDPEAAVEDYTIALEISPESYAYYIKRGTAYSTNEDYGSAVADFTGALVFEPNSIEAHTLRARAYTAQELYSFAIDDYDRAIELAPDTAELYVERGYLYLGTEETEDALDDFQKAVELDPFSPTTYKALADGYYATDQDEEALSTYRRYIETAEELGEAPDETVLERITELETRLNDTN